VTNPIQLIPLVPTDIWVVFDADWREPPGVVVATFATEAEAIEYLNGPAGDGYGWSVLHIPAPGWRRDVT
jgi:hypothetical protein